jgi:alpha-tubulin suppressor-like RCC1 family protein
VLDVDGAAWMFGRSERLVLGVPGDVVSENAPIRVTPQELGAGKGTKFVHAACGRSHTLLVGSDGRVWTCGVNNMGQVCVFEPHTLSGAV